MKGGSDKPLWVGVSFVAGKHWHLGWRVTEGPVRWFFLLRCRTIFTGRDLRTFYLLKSVVWISLRKEKKEYLIIWDHISTCQWRLAPLRGQCLLQFAMVPLAHPAGLFFEDRTIGPFFFQCSFSLPPPSTASSFAPPPQSSLYFLLNPGPGTEKERRPMKEEGG